MAIESIQVLWKIAARTPKVTPRVSATTSPASVSCRVGQIASRMRVGDRALVVQPGAHIAVHQIVHVGDVLLPERFVQPVLLADLLGQLGRDRFVPGEGLHRIARHEMGDQEGEERDAEENRDRLHAAPQDVRDHVECSLSRPAHVGRRGTRAAARAAAQAVDCTLTAIRSGRRSTRHRRPGSPGNRPAGWPAWRCR